MKYFFILGCHRSGTTLLQLALNRHSQIAIPAETKFFSSFLGHAHECQVRRTARINRDLQIAVPAPTTAVRGTLAAQRFFGTIAEAYAERLGKRQLLYFGEKTPAHSGYVPQIRRTFPDAKLIWLYRDGRDVALSMRNVPWLSRHLGINMLIWAFYAHAQQRLMRDGEAPALFVQYEELVTQPVHQLKRVTDFLELPFEPQVARGSGNREGVLEWEYAWKSSAFEPISDSRIGAWRKELSSTEVEMLESLGSRELRELGYELVKGVRKRWRAVLDPSLLVEVVKLYRRLPWDETANQLFGRAVWCR
jgi:sulfotransferase family protein